jgi:hypothetical protein
VSATTRGLLPGDWVYSSQIVDKAGHAPTTAFLDHACPVTLRSAQVLAATLFEHGPAPLGDHGSATVREDAHQT